jgi:hypothetical protein
MSWDGALRFARFAVPPNQLGYCGPADHVELRAYGSGELAPDGGLRRLAAGFDGAWPYLQLLAGAARTDDPLDDRVVEAYWIGNSLLESVAANDWGWHLVDRFGPRAGADLAAITESVGGGSVPCHAFHVLCVYPWVGMLRAGRGGDAPLSVIEQCRISWGVVRSVTGPTVTIDGPRLVWTGSELCLGPPVEDRVATWHPALAERLTPGSLVATHWGTVCDVLEPQQCRWLAATTRRQLAIANRSGAVGLVS